jgi:hypothetical protein
MISQRLSLCENCVEVENSSTISKFTDTTVMRNLLSNGYWGLFVQPGREADHSPTSSAEVKNDEAIPSLLHTFLWHGA